MNKKGLTISVVTVCYNAALTIENTIKSIICQDYANIEYIIIDGASTDGTLDIIKKYSTERTKKEFGHNISIWITESDSGIYDAMNKALQIASGDYLIFMGADDVFIDNYVISKVSDWLNKQKGSVVYGSVKIKSSGHIDFNPFKASKFVLGNICHQCIFYPREVYTKYQYDKKYKIYADYAYNLIVRRNYTFTHIPILISIFNDNGISGRCDDLNFNNDKKDLLISSIGWKSYIIGSVFRLLRQLKNRLLIK